MTAEHEKLEMEVLVSRSAGLNGDGGLSSGSNFGDADEEEDDDGTPNVFRQKCERLSRELQLAKQRLAQQHEDDLEQTVVLKKQLEKKLNDAYEEVEEQRQVVAQWKRKAQRLAGELNDNRLLHEDQSNRNAILEKKQRKYVAPCCSFVYFLIFFSFLFYFGVKGSTPSCSCCKTSYVKNELSRNERCVNAMLPSLTSLASNRPFRSVYFTFSFFCLTHEKEIKYCQT